MPTIGLTPAFLSVVIELDRAVHHAVVGQRDAVHAQLGRALGDALGGGVAVQQAVFGVDVKMDEIAAHNVCVYFNRLCVEHPRPAGGLHKALHLR